MTVGRELGAGLPSNRSRFALGAAVGLALVAVLGWLTGLRGALHGLVILSGALALLPFMIVAVLVLVLVGASVLAALVSPDAELFTAGAADGIATGGSQLTRVYYGLLWRLRRHALAWGAGAGLGLGAVGLLGVLWLFVIPRETETLGILLGAQARIDAEHRSTRRYPSPATDGYLRLAPPLANVASGAQGSAAPLRDAFGRPLLYRREGSVLLASYTLASLGFDGEESSDDICVTGQTRAKQLMERLRDPLELLGALRAGTLSWAEQAAALRDTRCSQTERGSDE